MTREKANAILGGGLAILAIILLWLLHSKGLLHAATSATLVPGPGGVLPAESGTGVPQYDTRNPATVPEQEAFAIPPITGNNVSCINGPTACCPLNYTLWKNVADGNYWCLPDSSQAVESASKLIV